jgi:hypothetical protein
VVLLPPSLDLLVFPLDHALLLALPIHRLELGNAPLWRKMADLAPVVPMVAHHLSPSCTLRPSEFLLHLHHQDQLSLGEPLVSSNTTSLETSTNPDDLLKTLYAFVFESYPSKNPSTALGANLEYIPFFTRM